MTKTYGELAEHFDVSTKAMESKIRRMGLKKQEILAEALASEAKEVFEAPKEPALEEPRPAPIETIQTLPQRTEIREETKEQKKARLAAAQEAAETEKTRREEERQEKPMVQATKKLEAGMKKMLQGKYEMAAADFEAILEEPPPDIGLLDRARQYLQACRVHLEADEAEPKTVDEFYNYGVIQMNAGDLAGALELFATANKKAPKDDRVLYCQAAAYAQTGDVDAALKALRKAIEVNEANRVYAKNDSDFTPLRVHQEFQQLVAPPEESN